MIDYWSIEMDEGNEIGDFRVFIGVGKLWVLPKIGCIA